jgi:hypothetical protein
MKNLKKVLALVLVVAMAFSLMTFAGAKFTDDADIKYDTAVGLMTGIGAINGYTDGSFKPAGLVTRAEAAKMVAFAILGPSVAQALKTSTTSFSDVPASHWASAYIEYCVGQGILNGLGDGTFNPNGNITGFALGKMMLCAVGYGENDEYVGANWEINVAKDAMQRGIFDGNETGNFAASATREECALYIFNGIYKVSQVDYNELFGYYGKGSAVTSPVAGKTIAEEVYKMVDSYPGTAAPDPMKGMVIGGSVTGETKTGTYVASANFTDGKVTSFNTREKYAFEAKEADIGQLVAIYYNSVTDQVYYTETLSTTITSIFGVTTAYTYVTTFGSASFTAAKAVYKITDSYNSVEKKDNPLTDTNATNATFLGMTVGSTAGAGNYAIYGDEIISLTSFPAKTFEKVTLVTTTTGTEAITFSASGKLSNAASSDKVKEYDGIKAGDYVVLTKTGSIYTVGKTTTVDGKISKVTNIFGLNSNATFPPTLTLDGKDITAAQASGAAGLAESLPSATTDYANNTYTLYLDEAGNWLICILKTGTSANNVVYLTGKTWTAVESYDTVTKAQAVNNAGEQVTYTSLTGLDTANHALTGGFYKIGTTGTTVVTNTFEPVSSATVGYGATFAPSTSTVMKDGTIKATGTDYYFASDVNFIFVSGTGANLKVTKVTGIAAVADNLTLDNTDLLYFNETSSPNKTVTTVIVSGAYAGAVATKTLFLNNSYGNTAYPTGSDSASYTYSAYIDGVKTTIKATNASATANVFLSYTVDKDGIYTFGAAITEGSIPGTAGLAAVYVDETIGINGIYNGMLTTPAGAYKTSANVVVVDLATSAFDPAIYTSVAAMEAITTANSFKISFVKDKNDEITVIYVKAVTLGEINIASQPAATATSTDATPAVLSVTATATTGTLSYQWQMYAGGTWMDAVDAAPDITGANTNTLTLGNLGAHYWTDGASYQYRCVITIAGSPITKTTNVVTVTYDAVP